VYRAIDQFGQVIDVFVSTRRDAQAARRFFDRALSAVKVTPVGVVTDKAAVYPWVLEELAPPAWHRTERYANNHVEADHGQLKRRLRPMRGSKTDGNHRWTRIRSKRPPRPLRTRGRRADPTTGRVCPRRARRGHLIGWLEAPTRTWC
jgi:transposase-like protein